MTDETLLKLIKDHPDEGLKLLVEQYEGLLFSVVRSVLTGWGERDVEECVSDVFSEFYFDIDKIDLSRGSVKAYLCVSAKHNALDLLRRASRRPDLPLDEADLSEAAAASTEETLLDADGRRELAQLVKDLGYPDSEIVFRKFYLSQPSKIIAAALGMTAANVDVRTHRALKKLRSFFESSERGKISCGKKT